MASLCKLEKDAPSSRCWTALLLLGQDALPPSAGSVHKLQFFEVCDVNVTTLNVCPWAASQNKDLKNAKEDTISLYFLSLFIIYLPLNVSLESYMM